MTNANTSVDMAQKPSQSQKIAPKNLPLKPSKVAPATTRIPFINADEFSRRRQTGPLSRYVE